jgi:hypothetical protein
VSTKEAETSPGLKPEPPPSRHPQPERSSQASRYRSGRARGLSSYQHSGLRLPQEAVRGSQAADRLPWKRLLRLSLETVCLVQPAGAI